MRNGQWWEATVAVCSVLLLAAGAELGAIGPALDAPAGVRGATTDGMSITIWFDKALLGPLDADAITIRVDDQPAVILGMRIEPAEGTLRLRFAPGGLPGQEVAVTFEGEAPWRGGSRARAIVDGFAMPWGGNAANVVDTGDAVLVLGGRQEPFGDDEATIDDRYEADDILSIDFDAGRIERAVSRMPVGIINAAVAWDPVPRDGCPGGCAYVFGGQTTGAVPTGLEDHVLRYDPVGDALTVMDAVLPTPRREVAAARASDGAIYLFGGEDRLGPLDEVLRFDPAAGTVTRLPVGLPTPSLGSLRAGFSSLSTTSCPQGCVYLFGGYVLVGGRSDPVAEIIRFNPALGLATVVVGATLDGAYSAVAVDQGFVLAVPHSSDPAERTEVHHFDPATETLADWPSRTRSESDLPLVYRAGEVWTLGSQDVPRNRIAPLYE